jgi:predicted AAA+ superfamily ATPase
MLLLRYGPHTKKTGRVVNLDLFVMTLSELIDTELPDMLVRLSNTEIHSSFKIPHLSFADDKRKSKVVELYLQQGGLPGVCFVRNDKMCEQMLLIQLETIINRDLRQVRRKTGISPITQKKILSALESVFMIRILMVERDYTGYAIQFEDQNSRVIFVTDSKEGELIDNGR